mgnify:CR=1 FL=1
MNKLWILRGANPPCRDLILKEEVHQLMARCWVAGLVSMIIHWMTSFLVMSILIYKEHSIASWRAGSLVAWVTSSSSNNCVEGGNIRAFFTVLSNSGSCWEHWRFCLPLAAALVIIVRKGLLGGWGFLCYGCVEAKTKIPSCIQLGWTKNWLIELDCRTYIQ